MATSLVVCGAAGRMGRALVQLIAHTPEARLVGAVEAPGHPALGEDAGAIAGVGIMGIALQENFASLARADVVALDFTRAQAALEHLRTAVAHGSPIVIGSTGYDAAQQAELDRLAAQTRSVVASNMSVGIAVLQSLARQAALMLGPDFDPEIVEIHHRLKVDAPSGTALTLGRAVAEATGRNFDADVRYGREGVIGPRTQQEIGILALRGGDIVGDHTVIFAGLAERIELTHRAQSRDCLARGALRAALWLPRQPVGHYGMADVLGLR